MLLKYSEITCHPIVNYIGFANIYDNNYNNSNAISWNVQLSNSKLLYPNTYVFTII